MEILHSDQPYIDFVTSIGETDRWDPAFVEAEARIDTLFQDLGAKVMYGVADAGEPPRMPELRIRERLSEAALAFHSRPA